MEKFSFIFENNDSLILHCWQMFYDSANEWKIKVCEAEQPQHRKVTEKVK